MRLTLAGAILYAFFGALSTVAAQHGDIDLYSPLVIERQGSSLFIGGSIRHIDGAGGGSTGSDVTTGQMYVQSVVSQR